jgi:lysophospholipase L1-like esterase
MVEVKQNLGIRDRPLAHIKRSAARSIRFARASSRVYPLPAWCFVSLTANVVMLALLTMAFWRAPNTTVQNSAPASASAPSRTSLVSDPAEPAPPDLGPRHQLTYEEWVGILEQEAQAMVSEPPPTLSILMGDSISLWFPHELLPRSTTWLNQGISGEISGGLLKRLDLIEETQPDYIFVMIGINDLLRDVSDDEILSNQQQIVRDLQEMHANATIVLQSILPHGGDRATWEGKDRLEAIPNERIQGLNAELAAIAREESIQFLDLTSLFSDDAGNLRMELSTDGLHLNDSGYLVWASALNMYQQLDE